MDYSYYFCDFTDNLANVQAIHHQANKIYRLQVCINDQQLTGTNALEISSMVADLVDLAASIYTADWLSPRKQNISHNIHLNLPLRNPDIFNDPNVVTRLQELLHWYTKDYWHFKFKSRFKHSRLAESSRKLDLSFAEDSIEVALWSGGLDSLAGLYNRLAEKTSVQYTLFGTGSNDFIQNKQRKIAEAVRKKFGCRIKLIQVPIQLHYLDPHKPPTNDLFRVRGFVFKLLGVLCAYLEGQHTLYIYENGFGAINLPYGLSDIGLAHTRSVHPISLLKVSEFISYLLNIPLLCDNPFLFQTKAQMCKVFTKAKATDLTSETVTCDGRHRQAEQPSQCGYCSSCLLRRLALAAAQIEDKTQYVVTHGTKPIDLSYRLHFEAMQAQVKTLQSILSSETPWQDIVQRYDDLRRIASFLARQEEVEPKIIQDKLLQLYRCHVEEWSHFQDIIRWEARDNGNMQYKQLEVAW